MDKQTIASFFDRCAPDWDSQILRNEAVIRKILDNAGVTEGVHVLDVACGTGVLFADYLSRGVASLTGIDIAPEMAKIAQAKFPEAKVICGDVEEVTFDRQFDVVMVYNAFPHFPDPAKLIRVLAGLVKPGGRISVAHGMSRDALTAHHAGRASDVSIDLLHEQQLADLCDPYFDVDVIISDDAMYQVSGVRRAEDKTVTPIDELMALLKYTVQHNDAHAQELAELAQQLKEAGKTRAYERLMDAVADFDMVNAKLDAVFCDLCDDM